MPTANLHTALTCRHTSPYPCIHTSIKLQFTLRWGCYAGMLIQYPGGAAILAEDAWEPMCSRPETPWFIYYIVFVACFCCFTYFFEVTKRCPMTLSLWNRNAGFLRRPLFLLLAWATTSMPSFVLALHPAMVSPSWLARWMEPFLALGWEIWPRSWPWLPRTVLWPLTWMQFAVQELLASCRPWERSQLELPWAQLHVPQRPRHWPPPRFWDWRKFSGYFDVCSGQPRNGDVLLCNKFHPMGRKLFCSVSIVVVVHLNFESITGSLLDEWAWQGSACSEIRLSENVVCSLERAQLATACNVVWMSVLLLRSSTNCFCCLELKAFESGTSFMSGMFGMFHRFNLLLYRFNKSQVDFWSKVMRPWMCCDHKQAQVWWQPTLRTWGLPSTKRWTWTIHSARKLVFYSFLSFALGQQIPWIIWTIL